MAYKKTTSSNTDLPQWAKNIKLLRKSRGELQFQLGNIIGYSDRAISAFENGRNTPSEEIFTKIADHYEVTLDMLLHEKLTKKIISQRNEIIDISMQTTWFNALCVRVKSNRALNDEHFIMATDCFEKLLSINTISTIFIRESFEKCKNAYFDSYKHSRIIAGAANTLMVIILEYAFLKVPPEMYGKDVIRNKDIELLSNKENSEEQMDFIKANEDIFEECLRALRNNPNTIDLYEYYLALKYLYGMTINDETRETNNAIGLALLMEYYTLDNKYVERLFDKLFEGEDD